MKVFEKSVKRFNEFAVEYAEKFMNIDSYKTSVDKFCDLILSDKPEILELACGPGNYTRYVKNRFPDSSYIAVDLAPKMIEVACKLVKGVDFRVMDVRGISAFNKKFDSILCSFCLPFLSKSDTLKLIADCASLLDKNGVIYISTMEGEESRAGFEATSFSGNSEIYFNYYQQKDIENSLIENGFRIYDIKRQDYIEPSGLKLVDMIFIATKI